MANLCKALDTTGKCQFCYAYLPQTKNEVIEQQQQQRILKINFGLSGDLHHNFKLYLVSGSFVNE